MSYDVDGHHDVSMRETASFVCDYCNQQNVIPVDVSGGSEQEYVEDCSICCRPNVVHIMFDDEGRVRIRSERAQD